MFGLLIFFAFVEMIQVAVLVASGNRHGYDTASLRDRLRFLLFVSLWTIILGGAYLAGFLVAAGSFLFSIASHTVFIVLTWIFWLVGAAALTGTLSGHVSGGDASYAHPNQLNSAEAFSWIPFVLSTILLIGIISAAVRSARSGNGFGGAVIA